MCPPYKITGTKAHKKKTVLPSFEREGSRRTWLIPHPPFTLFLHFFSLHFFPLKHHVDINRCCSRRSVLTRPTHRRPSGPHLTQHRLPARLGPQRTRQRPRLCTPTCHCTPTTMQFLFRIHLQQVRNVVALTKLISCSPLPWLLGARKEGFGVRPKPQWALEFDCRIRSSQGKFSSGTWDRERFLLFSDLGDTGVAS